MLSINQELYEIDDAIDEVVRAFLKLPVVQEYRQTRLAFLQSEDIQVAISDFQNCQEQYEEVKEFLAFRPDVAQLRRQLLSKKRTLDTHPKVIAYRQAEVALQEVLAELSSLLSQSISSDIFVDTGLPLAPKRPKHGHGRGDNIREKDSNVGEN
ncbi:YlbF family regulator [Streptococcus sp. FT1-106]|uniref:YlbF family regulator n=1 Tax=Streptococcus sp. FT1-106 TaxID=3409994 RepID=UPI003BF5D2B2